MKTLVVYESMFGNTRDIARAVAEGLVTWSNVAINDVDAIPGFVTADLVVLGGPTHAFSMSRASTREDAVRQGAIGGTQRGLRDWINEVIVDQPTALATFDTHTKQRWVPGSASKSAAREGREQGFWTLDTQSFFVEGVHGPLVAGELERARHWGRTLRARLAAQSR